MKINDNGVLRDMTAEEIAMMALSEPNAVPEPTEAERLEALESAMLELLGVAYD